MKLTFLGLSAVKRTEKSTCKRKGGRSEAGRKRGKDRWMNRLEGREGVREGRREGVWEGGKEGGRESGREGERREGGSKEGKEVCTVPLTSNLTRSCESLASRSRVQLSALARRIGYTRENTGLHS